MVIRGHWHAARADMSVSRNSGEALTALGSEVGFGEKVTAQGTVEADKASHAGDSLQWFLWPCVCREGSRFWAKVDSAVWCNLNS
jgi:hypothetical protein